MDNQLTPQQALNMLYQATRSLGANAEIHEQLRRAAGVLEDFIMSDLEEKQGDQDGEPKKK